MANANLFNNKTKQSKSHPTAVNNAGGRAYNMTDKHALAQFAVTGMFGNTFYTDAKSQLDKVIELSKSVDDEFLAKVAIYSRKHGYLKDMPALLVAILASRDVELCKKVFPVVIDNGKMLRNFVQIIRSGVTGRKSLGSAPKKMVKEWLRNATDDQVFKASVGNSPSLADVIKMVHPAPETPSRDHLYAYITKRKYDGRSLPKLVKEFEKFKGGTPGNRRIPQVPFQMLDSLVLTDSEWVQVAANAPWQMTRMNLNTFARHGVFNDTQMTKMIASRLANKSLVAESKVFPYQLLQAWKNVDISVPASVKAALEDALEASVDNVPSFDGKVYVGVDFSGSMSQGVNNGGTWKAAPVSCNEVASLFASCILRKNPDTEIYRFDTSAHMVILNPRDSIMTNAQKIGQAGGGTDCSCVLRELNKKQAKGDVVVILSDMESWVNSGSRTKTALQAAWDVFVERNPHAKLICIDLAANHTVQAVNRSTSVLNVGGFSDSVFKVAGAFLESDGTDEYWTNLIETNVSLD